MGERFDNDRAIRGKFSIGMVAQQTGVKIETIRYYEREGLIPNPPRSGGGHRIYGTDELKRLAFIRRCRELGFTLDQIRGLLRFVDNREYTCAEVQSLTLEHLVEVRQKIVDLTRIEHVLADMAASCEGGQVPECPIIDTLFDAGAAPTG